ncbi:MAG TPA: LemA family protein [Candidatus Coproplasma avicola]|uniref:LemA family protein n=1 Tax=Candidatus Coproplasma avicola TaxID=2840744 RepID=A0A9D1J915_9FIRM|nr:LemA family protein [Candidatus Coproplasma avicola]
MEGWVIALIIVAVIVLIAVIIICWAISVRNNFVRMRNTSEEAFATIDVYLKKRYDLIPNLVETVKGYAKHESRTLEEVIKARNNAASATTTAEKIEADAQLSNAIKSINIVAERYPDLKANTNFQNLMNELRNIEAELANSRKYYNGTVKVFNTEKDIFPKSIIANSMKLEKFPYFELDSEEERKNVKVSF